ncbi:hypothetical protein ACIQAL_21680 [Pseudomonas sp. NPDC088368]|uniref:hypothetical protein n=1 Tax=Pseudomonas sp. NPDC088368 TaxID=3364453 RepID=UPI00381F7D61
MSDRLYVADVPFPKNGRTFSNFLLHCHTRRDDKLIPEIEESSDAVSTDLLPDIGELAEESKIDILG